MNGAKGNAGLGWTLIVAVIGTGNEAPKRIPVTARTRRAESFGEFVLQRAPHARPVRIVVAAGGPFPGLTFVHEIGHYLDRFVLPGHDGATRKHATDPLLAGWRKAVAASAAYNALKGERAARAALGLGGAGRYLLRPSELWARSFAQYIAEKTRDPSLTDAVAGILADHDALVANSQWLDADFRAVARALDDLFIKIGWRQ